MKLTVACAQIAPVKADLQANYDKITDSIIQASGEGADLVVFAETATTGYFLEGGVVDGAITGETLFNEVSSRVNGHTQRSVDALIGFYQSENGNLYNSAAYLELGSQPNRLVHVYKK